MEGAPPRPRKWEVWPRTKAACGQHSHRSAIRMGGAIPCQSSLKTNRWRACRSVYRGKNSQTDCPIRRLANKVEKKAGFQKAIVTSRAQEALIQNSASPEAPLPSNKTAITAIALSPFISVHLNCVLLYPVYRAPYRNATDLADLNRLLIDCNNHARINSKWRRTKSSSLPIS